MPSEKKHLGFIKTSKYMKTNLMSTLKIKVLARK